MRVVVRVGVGVGVEVEVSACVRGLGRGVGAEGDHPSGAQDEEEVGSGVWGWLRYTMFRVFCKES